MAVLHKLMQGAVVLVFGAELVEGGDFLPVIVGRGFDGFKWCLVEETIKVPLSELFGVFSGV